MKRCRLIMTALLGFCMFAAVPDPPVPLSVTYTGRLSQVSGPVTGMISALFAIYDSKENGTALWSEEYKDYDAVPVNNGFFTVSLGSQKTLDTTVLTGEKRWLEITINNQAMSPRVPINSVPYSILAGNVLGDITPSSVSVGGISVIDNTGKWVGSPTGLQGPKGDTGAQGLQGLQGLKGDKGDKGDTGTQGIQGVKGDKGNTGAQGPQGIPGILAAGQYRQWWDAGLITQSFPSWVFFGGNSSTYKSSQLTVATGDSVAVWVSASLYEGDQDPSDNHTVAAMYVPCYQKAGVLQPMDVEEKSIVYFPSHSQAISSHLIFTGLTAGTYDFGLCATRPNTNTTEYSNFYVYSPHIIALRFKP